MAPCAPDTWMSSPRMVVVSTHSIGILVFPLHLVAAFCILRKTPSSMSSVKLTILNLHFWNSVVDLGLNVFVVPCLLVPSVAGHLVGLLNVFRVPPSLQCGCLIVPLSFVCFSTTMIFENRFYLLIAVKTKWKLIRRLWIPANFLFCVLYLAPMALQIPDQQVAREYVLNTLPCVPEFLNDVEIIVPTLDNHVFIFTVLVFFVVVFGQLIVFTAIILFHLSSNFGANVLSADTRRLQKNLLKALILQTGIPFIYLLLPVALAAVAIYKSYFSLVLNNMMVIVVSLHGFVSTSSIILIHKPYRTTVASLLKFTSNALSKCQLTVGKLRHRCSLYSSARIESSPARLLTFTMTPCSPGSETWISSPHLVRYFTHFMSVLVFPLHLLGAFCILKKTPPSMSSVKWTILNLHFWNTVFDAILNTLVVPCLLLPSVSGYLVGLLSDFGVSLPIQAWILVTVCSITCFSTTMIFENRFYLLIAKRTVWKSLRPFWLYANFVFCFAYLLPAVWQFPDQKLARDYVLNSLPCVPEFLLTTEIVVPTTESSVFFLSALAFVAVVFGQLVMFTAIIAVKLSSNFGASVLSAETRRLQKNLLKALILQTGTPFLFMGVPVALGTFVISTGYFDLGLNNVIIIIASFHGLVSTTSIILIHTPYRMTVIVMFERKTQRVTDANITPSHPMHSTTAFS